MLKVSPEELTLIASLVRDISGIFLDQTKAYLVESRLGPVAEEFGCASFKDLYFKARNDAQGKMIKRVIDSITTQETSFFRDRSPFDLFKFKLLPEMIDRAKKASPAGPWTLRIWSAASSTGQEAYSLAISIREMLPDYLKWRISILGTDISDAAVTKASYARYTAFELERGFPQEKIQQYFKPVEQLWQVKDEIRAMASFRQLNLMLPFTALGRFDMILCRNVAIYFSLEVRRNLFDRLADQLSPDGCLLIGSTESLLGVSERYRRFEYNKAVFYKLAGAA